MQRCRALQPSTAALLSTAETHIRTDFDAPTVFLSDRAGNVGDRRRDRRLGTDGGDRSVLHLLRDLLQVLPLLQTFESGETLSLVGDLAS